MSEPVEHRDVGVRYVEGMFVVTCTCGQEFKGLDPDDAEFAALEHINEARP